MQNFDQAALGEVIIYRSADGQDQLEVHFGKDTVWLTLNQMADLFERDKSVISRHLRTIFSSGELDKKGIVAKNATVQMEGGRKVARNIEWYNLDAIISVGYRVNSMRGTQFRIWATNVLKQHLIQGYTINQRRLKEHTESLKTLQQAVKMLADLSSRKSLTSDEAKGLFEVIRDYSYGLDVLDDYDHGRTQIKSATAKEGYQLTYEEGLKVIGQMRQKFGASGLFGNEKDAS